MVPSSRMANVSTLTLPVVRFIFFCFSLFMSTASLPPTLRKMLNPDAKPYVRQCPCLYISINPTCYPPFPTPQPHHSLFHCHQASFYKNSWYYSPSHLASLTTSLSTFNPTPNNACANEFDCKEDIKPKSKVPPEEETEPHHKPRIRVVHRRPFPYRFEPRKASVPKPKVQPIDVSSFDLNESETECGGRTTVMIKNIPGRFTRMMLLDLLDKHCVEENERAQSSLSEYDFVYLPIDFRYKLNLGYAFVNFTTSRAAKTLYKSMNNVKWETFGSKKICQITYATIQGKEALEGHFRKKNFKCDSEAYLPIMLSPPRNGSTSRPPPSVVGILRGRFGSRRI